MPPVLQTCCTLLCFCIIRLPWWPAAVCQAGRVVRLVQLIKISEMLCEHSDGWCRPVKPDRKHWFKGELGAGVPFSGSSSASLRLSFLLENTQKEAVYCTEMGFSWIHAKRRETWCDLHWQWSREQKIWKVCFSNFNIKLSQSIRNNSRLYNITHY